MLWLKAPDFFNIVFVLFKFSRRGVTVPGIPEFYIGQSMFQLMKNWLPDGLVTLVLNALSV
jgi:hypothetical protein